MTSPLALVLDDPDFSEGNRTTLCLPDAVSAAAQTLAEEIGTSRNDALIRLAVAGARVMERAREIARRALAGAGRAGDQQRNASRSRGDACFVIRSPRHRRVIGCLLGHVALLPGQSRNR
jgi:hypothetical protein